MHSTASVPSEPEDLCENELEEIWRPSAACASRAQGRPNCGLSGDSFWSHGPASLAQVPGRETARSQGKSRSTAPLWAVYPNSRSTAVYQKQSLSGTVGESQ